MKSLRRDFQITLQKGENGMKQMNAAKQLSMQNSNNNPNPSMAFGYFALAAGWNFDVEFIPYSLLCEKYHKLTL